MLQMSRKQIPPSVEGTGTAIRQAARSSAPSLSGPAAKAKRRTFTAEFKREVLREVDAARASRDAGAVGEVLRRRSNAPANLIDANHHAPGELEGRE